MKNKLIVQTIWLSGIVSIAIILAGCSKSTRSAVTSPVSDKSMIQESINSNPDLFAVDQVEEGDIDYSPVAPSAPSLSPLLANEQPATLPVGWGRKITGAPDKDIDIDIVGDGAYVTITKKVEGNLYIDRTDDGQRNPGSKPFDVTVVKKAYFEKVFGHWQLKELSCADVDLAEQSQQTVSITSIEASGTNSSGEVHYIITSPDALMDINTGLPAFVKGTEVKVIATVNNANQQWTPPVFVFLHLGVGQYYRNEKRRLLYDDGTHGDEIAGDGKYTNTWTVGSGEEIYRHATIDVLDSGCLQNENQDDYNAVAWRIPYKAE